MNDERLTFLFHWEAKTFWDASSFSLPQSKPCKNGRFVLPGPWIYIEHSWLCKLQVQFLRLFVEGNEPEKLAEEFSVDVERYAMTAGCIWYVIMWSHYFHIKSKHHKMWHIQTQVFCKFLTFIAKWHLRNGWQESANYSFGCVTLHGILIWWIPLISVNELCLFGVL